MLLLLPWWTLHDPGICEPGWAWVELELFPSTNPPAAPFTTPGDICRDPYRPGHVVVVLFCLRPINYPAPPPRHRPILSIRLCVTYTHTPSSPGGIHPSVDKYQPRPVFAIVYKSLLDHTCLTSPAYIFADGSAYIRTSSQSSPATLSKGPPISCSSISRPSSLSPSWLLLLHPSHHPLRTVLAIITTTTTVFQQSPIHLQSRIFTRPPSPIPGCVTSQRTTTSTRRAWTRAHTSSAHQSTATGNWPAPRVLTRGISSSRAHAPCAPDERPGPLTHWHLDALSHMKGLGGSATRNSGWTTLSGGRRVNGTMGTRHSTVVAPQEGKALAWSAEVAWTDDTGGRKQSPPSERLASARDQEWCTGSLDSASDTGTAGGDVVLSWSWTSSWR